MAQKCTLMATLFETVKVDMRQKLEDDYLNLSDTDVRLLNNVGLKV